MIGEAGKFLALSQTRSFWVDTDDVTIDFVRLLTAIQFFFFSTAPSKVYCIVPQPP